jgi:hypothetical protein
MVLFVVQLGQQRVPFRPLATLTTLSSPPWERRCLILLDMLPNLLILPNCLHAPTLEMLSDPRVYASKTPGNDSDMPTFQQAMNGSEASEYIYAMKVEIQTLVG